MRIAGPSRAEMDSALPMQYRLTQFLAADTDESTEKIRAYIARIRRTEERGQRGSGAAGSDRGAGVDGARRSS